MGLAGRLIILAQNMSNAPHDAIGDGDAIASNKARIGLVELFLDMSEEGTPLISDNLGVCGVLLRSAIEAEENFGVC